METVNLYAMGQEIIKAKQAYYLNFSGDTNKLDGDLAEEAILEMEEKYIEMCKLYNDYDENDPVLNWC